MKNRVLQNQVAIQIIQMSPLFARIASNYGLQFLGVFGAHNMHLLPREYLITATVIEDGSLFDKCMREAPPVMKLTCFKMVVEKAKSMGFKILALRLPTKWERFKLWGWRQIPKKVVERKKEDKSPIPVTMRPPQKIVVGRPYPTQGGVTYGQRLPR